MLGTAFGYLLGGVLGDVYGIRRPFEVAFFLYITSSIYGALFLPEAPAESHAEKKNPRGVGGFFAPLKVIVPQKYIQQDGKLFTSYGLIFLALGIFLGVFASTYAPTLLQMYATSEFGFGTKENGWLMFGNGLIRGLFLLVMFPKIISAGRTWVNGTDEKPHHAEAANGHAEDLPIEPRDFAASPGEEVPQEPIKVPEPEEEEDEDVGTTFDLMFVRWSLVVDSIVTAIAGFSSQGWQVYMGKSGRTDLSVMLGNIC